MSFECPFSRLLFLSWSGPIIPIGHHGGHGVVSPDSSSCPSTIGLQDTQMYGACMAANYGGKESGLRPLGGVISQLSSDVNATAIRTERKGVSLVLNISAFFCPVLFLPPFILIFSIIPVMVEKVLFDLFIQRRWVPLEACGDFTSAGSFTPWDNYDTHNLPPSCSLLDICQQTLSLDTSSHSLLDLGVLQFKKIIYTYIYICI